MSTWRTDSTMRVPPVLPHLCIRFEDDRNLAATLDDHAYDVPPDWHGSEAVRRVIDQVTTSLGPVRVEVIESDGTVFTDIATPAGPEVGEPERPPAGREPSPFEASGEGYLPDERVMICVVVGEHAADSDGTARLHLPPALRSRRRTVVLLGRTSGTVTVLETKCAG